MNEELFGKFEALMFDDVLIVPATPRCCPTRRMSRRSFGAIQLNIPLISAAMDTVTEARPGDRPGARGRAGHHPPQPIATGPGR